MRYRYDFFLVWGFDTRFVTSDDMLQIFHRVEDLRYFFCGSFVLFCLVFVMPLFAYVYMCLVVTCWERAASWLSFVVSNSEFVTFPLVSWVRCGT